VQPQAPPGAASPAPQVSQLVPSVRDSF
jgi:hypothetical protein